MADRKFQLDQRVHTPMGDGVVVTMPYNDLSDTYIVWLDKPYVALGTQLTHEFVCEERKMTAI